jgi:hypothetical protein
MPTPRFYFDRVKDSTTTTGTGDLTLSGSAPTGFKAFASKYNVGDYFYYTISSTGGAEWEVGIGHLSAVTTLVRDSILDSNTGGTVSLSAGTKDVFVTIPARHVQNALTQGRGYANVRGIRLN